MTYKLEFLYGVVHRHGSKLVRLTAHNAVLRVLFVRKRHARRVEFFNSHFFGFGNEFGAVLYYLLFELGQRDIYIIVHIVARHFGTHNRTVEHYGKLQSFDVVCFFKQYLHLGVVLEKFVEPLHLFGDNVFEFFARVVILGQKFDSHSKSLPVS